LFDLPEDLPIELTPFTFLIGSWQGHGVVSYPIAEREPTEHHFFQVMTFTPLNTGRLEFSSTVSDLEGNLMTHERGFWMLSHPSSAANAGPGLLPKTAKAVFENREELETLRNERGGFDIEALIIQPEGIAELYFGQIKGARVDIGTDAVLRSPNAREYSAAQRMFGLVEGSLMWAWDMAAIGQPLNSHASAKLERILD
jgi:hypothetical protein